MDNGFDKRFHRLFPKKENFAPLSKYTDRVHGAEQNRLHSASHTGFCIGKYLPNRCLHFPCFSIILILMGPDSFHLFRYSSSVILCSQNVTASENFVSSVAESFSTSAWRLFPFESIVTITGKLFTRMCHIASGTPNSRKSTPSTSSMHFA